LWRKFLIARGTMVGYGSLLCCRLSGFVPLLASWAPLDQYLIKNQESEIALARSAAPPSVSNDAEILVLTSHGYQTAVKGKNGFVCLVDRSWQSSIGDPEFWNPKERAPTCLNST